LANVHNSPIVIVVGATGSGKSTQTPQFLLDDEFCEGKGKIACTQPRKVAAMSLAKRLSKDYQYGTKVDYITGGMSKSSKNNAKSQLLFVTDRILLQDWEMKQFLWIILDEVHKRTIETDILLALTKRLCKTWPELRVVVTSATLNKKLFKEYFENCPLLKVPAGWTAPITCYWLYSEEDFMDMAETQTAEILRWKRITKTLIAKPDLEMSFLQVQSRHGSFEVDGTRWDQCGEFQLYWASSQRKPTVYHWHAWNDGSD